MKEVEQGMLVPLQDLIKEWDRICADPSFESRPTAGHSLVMKRMPDLKSAGIETVLDIGCGHGFVINEFKVHGFKVSGTELIPSLFKKLKDFNVYPYGISEIRKNFHDGQFDLVLLVDVINCMQSILEIRYALETAWKIAKKALVVTVGSAGMFTRTRMSMNEWEMLVEEVCNDVLAYRYKKTDAILFLAWKND